MTIEAYAMAHGAGRGKGNKPKRKGGIKDALAQFAPGLSIPGVTENPSGD